ncbi:uncharacterized protein LOC124314684 [Daphnia pulicaria]|uniref:uncharacterized protein LOC124314684 n=1 Tax=Daphnia pulicaria TaxID=35523 RepID=UPI001EEA944F|nr:uncharacterized protein LOC124314684 [Daphnia pulicaria]
MFPCPNFAKCLKTFETKAKQSNHYKNCLIDRICHRCVSKPVFKSESGFRYHAKMHKDPTYPTVVRYGVGDTVHQPTPDPPQPSIDNFLPRDSLPAESGDGGSYVTEIAEEVEEAETEESLYIQQQLANVIAQVE